MKRIHLKERLQSLHSVIRMPLVVAAIILLLLQLRTSPAMDMPKESFVMVRVKTFSKITSCEGSKEKCEKILNNDKEMQGLRKGSGLVIRHQDNKSWILTAAHVCQAQNPESLVLNDAKLKMTTRLEIKVIDFFGNLHNATTIHFDELNDLCLMSSPGTWGKVVRVSPHAPEYGETVYNLAGPYGIFSPKMVLMFKGIYSGNDFGGNEMFTFPARPGSSGSAIFNESGELVSVLHSAARNLENLAIGCGYENLVAFISTYLK
ncbi:hypothetical protein CL614_07925 [archaeon]|nr:hypothetical protein [archaeon]